VLKATYRPVRESAGSNVFDGWLRRPWESFEARTVTAPRLLGESSASAGIQPTINSRLIARQDAFRALTVCVWSPTCASTASRDAPAPARINVPLKRDGVNAGRNSPVPSSGVTSSARRTAGHGSACVTTQGQPLERWRLRDDSVRTGSDASCALACSPNLHQRASWGSCLVLPRICTGCGGAAGNASAAS
jgi:hypothetical protein